MYLKSLELQGFKSFPDKTKLIFENGTTVIVGPNGSGKSNISDAMRWVLGEISTKSIRSAKMEDIIFGGADGRRPMSYAEVSVTFDNTDPDHRLESPFDEVTVTRRYYRAGESEYFINRRAVRLKDIYELFMNTGIGRDGYSIIGQGKIAEIVSKKSDERRSIFEDASGIAKYRFKKNEAERKLKATEDNMTRVNDLFGEVCAQLGPLEKDAEKAKRAIELLEAKKKVDVQLWLYDTDRLHREVQTAEENFMHSSFDLQNANEAIQAYEQQTDKLNLESQNNRRVSAELLEKINARTAQNYEIDSRYKVNEKDISHCRELIAEAEGAVQSLRRTLSEEDGAYNERNARLTALNEKVQQLRAEHSEAEQKSAGYEAVAIKLQDAIDMALADIRALENEAIDIKVRQSVIENAQLTNTDKNSSIVSELEEYAKVSQKYSDGCAEKQKTVDKYDEQIAGWNAEAEQKSSELENAEQDRALCDAEVARIKLELDTRRQRIDTFRAMEEQFEGYSASVRFVMKRYAEGKITNQMGIPCGRIYGPLSKLISVDDKYVNAIETALGANLQHIVVEDESVAKSAMAALKRENAGRATFFPLTSMRGQTPSQEMKEASGYAGYVGVADELVKCDSKFREILSSLAGRTLVFDNIDNATTMAKAQKYRVRVVTLDGQQINFGGSFTGGSTRSSGSILGRVGEIKRLETEVVDLEKSLVVKNQEKNELDGKILSLRDERNALVERAKLIEVIRSGEAATLEQLRAKLDANNTLIEKLKSDIAGIAEQQQRQAEDIDNLRRREAEIKTRIVEIGEFRSAKDVERNELLDRKSECDSRIIELHISISEAQKDIETEQTLQQSAAQRAEICRSDISDKQRRIAELGDHIERLTAEQTDNRAASRAGVIELEHLNAERAKAEQGSLEYERMLNELAAKTREKQNQRDLIYRNHTANESKLENLRNEQEQLSTKLWDDYQLTRAEAVALGYPALDEKSRSAAVTEQTSCRNRLRVIGNVDLDAVNKYNEVKARHDVMEAQIKDLDKAKKDLLSVIGDLEHNMESSFIESFNKINENFNRVFSELFGGGSAKLSLTDPANVLESGIEISAAPPGKIIKNLMQLSGGEQSFVAIALFFAILQVNPTPFCILDEIEAALDEVNVGRFAEYIKKYSDGTQFVLITHRRGTMEAANRLYGVTMPQHGISKVLTLDVDDISKTRGDDWNGIFG